MANSWRCVLIGGESLLIQCAEILQQRGHTVAAVVSTRAIEDFAVRAKVSSCILMPGSQHEILQETDAVRTRFWAAFDAYLGVEMKVA